MKRTTWTPPMHRFRGTILRTGLVVLFLTAASRAQVPAIDDPVRFDNDALGEDWSRIGAYQVVRRLASTHFVPSLIDRDNRDVTALLMETGFSDRDYLEAYRWATEFLALFPSDGGAARALYVKGVSAFQLRLLDAGLDGLNTLLSDHPDAPGRGEAWFWRAMIRIDAGDTDGAESDLTAMMDDPASAGSREDALFGWALSLERRGELPRSRSYLDSLLAEYPDGRLATDAKIRSASISLRLGENRAAYSMLGRVAPDTPAQEEELYLLNGETAFRLGEYPDAVASFRALTTDYPGSPLASSAELGLAWAYIRNGSYDDAREHLDSLSKRTDSVGIAALYQSGVLALLTNDVFGALAIFDTLTYRSPYDRYAERAYIQMGMIQYRSRWYRDAKKNFSFAARLFPDSPRRPLSYRMTGESCMGINDFSNAQYAFAQVRKLGGPDELVSASMMKEGIALYHLGRFRSSGEILGDYLKRFPSGPAAGNAMLWRAEALYQDGGFDEAERAYSDARVKLPDGAQRATADYGLAWTQFEQKKFTSAAASFERFSKQYRDDPRTAEADLRRADCYFFLGQYDRSGALYSALADRGAAGGLTEYAAFQLGMSYIQRGDAGRGIGHLRNFLTKYPGSIYGEVVQFNIAWTYFSGERYDTALGEFGVFMRDYPGSQLMPRVYFNTADAWYNMKQYDSARAYYQKVLSDFPSSPLVSDAMTGLQYTYQAEGKPAGALAEIDKFLDATPGGSSREELIMRKGDILFGQGDYAGAALEYQSMLKLNPSRELRARALYQLGRAYELEDNQQQAVSYYEEILKNFDDTEVAQNVRLMTGESYIKLKRYRAAVGVLENFAAKYPDSRLLSEASYQLAVAQMNVPDRQAAKRIFREVIAAHPDDIFADRSRLQLARLHIEAKEYRMSLDTLERVVARRNDDLAAEALLLMGESYLSLKKPADALQAFRDVYEQYTEFPILVERAYLGGGESYERLRDTRQAAALYEKIVKNPVDPAMKQDAEERLRRLRK
ncbi:MAG TPA: tetratricopeptide repeat protein [Bacteroidota bacterium]|nr:tetratricopeptide repeat protein [Bacteroidota bacterium]